MKWFVVIFLFFGVCASGTQAKNLLTIDTAERKINITTGFDGAEISVYGVTDMPGDIAVVVKGPEKTMIVRHKQPVFGTWINIGSVEFRRVPGFYDYALSRFEKDLNQEGLLDFHKIGFSGLDFYPENERKPEVAQRYRDALLRNKQTEGLFPLDAKTIEFLNDHFFRANFILPANVPSGIYTIEVYFMKEGKLLEMDSKELRVGQVGFNARIYSFAHDKGLFYGLLAVFIAVFAGVSGYSLLRRDP